MVYHIHNLNIATSKFLKIICITQLFIPLNLKTTAIEALGNSKLSMKIHISGIIISYIYSLPTGASIVVINLIIYLIFIITKKLITK